MHSWNQIMANRRWHSDTLYNSDWYVKLSVEYYKYVKINTYRIIYKLIVVRGVI